MIPKFKEPIVYFDVDDTLVSWDYHHGFPGPNKLEFEDPSDGSVLYLEIIQENIDALINHKAIRKHTVVVWSAGGADWAEEVVRKLCLSKYVDVIMSKPTWFYDDLPAGEFMEEKDRKHLRLKGKK